MALVKVNETLYSEKFISDLIKMYDGAIMVDKTYKKVCGNCGNDLTLPYNFCRFCGYKVKED